MKRIFVNEAFKLYNMNKTMAQKPFLERFFYDQLDRQKLGQLNPFVEPVFLTDGQFAKKAIGYFGSILRSAPMQFIFQE